MNSNLRKKGNYTHFPSASREWFNNTYTYNKVSLVNTTPNDSMLTKLIKMYLNFIPKNNTKTKSKRMRDLMRRYTTKQTYFGTPQVNQTSDKVNINIFTFDRHKYKYNKKLYFLNKRINNLKDSFIYTNSVKSIKRSKSLFNTFFLSKKKVSKKKRSKLIPSKFINRLNTVPMLNNIIKSFTKYKQICGIKSRFYYLKYLFNSIGMYVIILRKGRSIYIMRNNKIEADRLKRNTVIVSKNITDINNNSVFAYKNKSILNKQIIIDSNAMRYSFEQLNHKSLNNINVVLYNLLFNKLNFNVSRNIITNKTIFDKFSRRYINKVMLKQFRKQKLLFNYLFKSYLNKRKMNTLLPGLKSIIHRIYNKEIVLNFINLKYIFLNSDMITEAVAIKLRKKTSKLLRVLRKAIKLVSIPNFNFNKKTFIDNSKINMFRRYNVNMLTNTNNKLHSILSRMFKSGSRHKSNFTLEDSSNNISNILTSLKYKWVAGIRLEAKGRLTKRFTASRALFKYKYKGSLKDIEKMNKSRINLRQISTVMVRNQTRPNIQYSHIAKKRRIGVYGIKGWISSV